MLAASSSLVEVQQSLLKELTALLWACSYQSTSNLCQTFKYFSLMPVRRKTDLIPIMQLGLMELSQFLCDTKIKAAPDIDIAFILALTHFQKYSR